jgi:hypothetical protein
VIGRGHVFNHLTKRTHTLEFAICRGKPEFVGGHGIDCSYDQLFSDLQERLQCSLFPLCVEERYILCVTDLPAMRQEIACC